MKTLASFLAGRWHLADRDFQVLTDPSTEEPLARASSAGADFAAAVDWARRVGGPALAALSFGRRGEILKALSKKLREHRDELLDLSKINNGATASDGSFDVACSSFGAVPFVADSAGVMREVARVLRPGGRFAFSVTHPTRWAFPDDPGPRGLTVQQSYFDRSPYVERADDGTPTYVEHHRTLGDYVRALTNTGFVLEDLVEPEWPKGHTRNWGQWSPLRGKLFPGTAIFRTRLTS